MWDRGGPGMDPTPVQPLCQIGDPARMDTRILELSYDLATIPGRNPHNPADPRVFRFRDAAMKRIDAVLLDDGLGRGLDADLEADRLRLRFAVEDFEAAEARVGSAISDLALVRPAEMLRYWDKDAVI